MGKIALSKNQVTGSDLEFKKKELALKVTKEIVIKFIEMGKVTPASFDETFDVVFKKVSSSVSNPD